MTTVNNLPVTLQDQQCINRYSYLIYTATRLARSLETAKQTASDQKEAVEEISVLELEHDDPSDGPRVPVRAGSAYFHLPLGCAREQAERAGSRAGLEVQALQREHDAAKSEMAGIKKQLEAKFGDSIRLE